MFAIDVGGGQSVSVPALMLAGLLIGQVAGMFGVGGGFLLTPVLLYVFGVPAPIAVGSSLCQNIGSSLASFLKYRALGRGESRVSLVMLGGSVMGVDAGTRLLAYLSRLRQWQMPNGQMAPAADVVLSLLFIVVLSGTALYTFRDAMRALRTSEARGDQSVPGPLVTGVRIPPYVDLPRVGLKAVSVPMMAYMGFLLGVASGMMGIGGGVLFTPILIYGFGISMRNAAGTGVLLAFITATLGTISQALHGFVSLPLAMSVLIGSSIGTQIGAITTHTMPNRHLRLIFSLLVGATVLLVVWDLWKTALR